MPADLIIYGTDWCPHCHAAKDDLAAYQPTFVDCEEDREACKDAGVKGYPKIVNGEKSVRGWPNKGTKDTTPYMRALGLA